MATIATASDAKLRLFPRSTEAMIERVVGVSKGYFGCLAGMNASIAADGCPGDSVRGVSIR